MDHLGNCSQLCTNSIGSYTCSCTTGYTLSTDERSCIGKSEMKCNQVHKRVHFIFETAVPCNTCTIRHIHVAATYKVVLRVIDCISFVYERTYIC